MLDPNRAAKFTYERGIRMARLERSLGGIYTVNYTHVKIE